MPRISIEGKFLTQTLTGTQRYSAEMIRGLDALCDKGEFELVVPENAIIKGNLGLTRISVVRTGRRDGPAWMHLDFAKYCKSAKTTPLCLGNVAPVFSKCCVTIHDVSPRANKNFYDWKYRIYQNICASSITKSAQLIFTDTHFSKSEIEHYYPQAKGKISVIPCGWQHMNAIAEDETAFSKFELLDGGYWFALSSLTPNKNLRWIAETAKLNPRERFVVAGGINVRTFGEHGIPTAENVSYLGYVTDGEAKALMRHCKGFVYPTFYEGFGLPPMEAMASGAPLCIVGDNPCMHEVYGEAVVYVDPKKPCGDIASLEQVPVSSTETLLNMFSWQNSAKCLLKQLREVVSHAQ